MGGPLSVRIETGTEDIRKKERPQNREHDKELEQHDDPQRPS